MNTREARLFIAEVRGKILSNQITKVEALYQLQNIDMNTLEEYPGLPKESITDGLNNTIAWLQTKTS